MASKFFEKKVNDVPVHLGTNLASNIFLVYVVQLIKQIVMKYIYIHIPSQVLHSDKSMFEITCSNLKVNVHVRVTIHKF